MRLSNRLPVAIGPIKTDLYGGPYKNKPGHLTGIKMAAEIDRPCAINIPTEDFSTPDPKVFREGIIKGLNLMLAGQPLYVGCWGGIGRTGMYMAGIAKVMAEYRRFKKRSWMPPIDYVRKHYDTCAVETAAQRQFINDFDVSDIVVWMHNTSVMLGHSHVFLGDYVSDEDWGQETLEEIYPPTRLERLLKFFTGK